jgi:hypothetical protein
MPAYLERVGPANHYYGTLQYEASTNSWIIKGEAFVCQMAKKLFPGCDGKGRRLARFYSNKRTVGDLNWLMLRYPLKIKDTERWEKAFQEALDYAVKRELINRYPVKEVPDSAYFSGELMEFQKEGLGFLLHNNRSLLADEMGLGKTVQALAFIARTKSFPSLIVVPPHLMANWRNEIHRFLKIPSDGGADSGVIVHVISGLQPYHLPPADIYIIHYLLLRGWKHVLPSWVSKVSYLMRYRSSDTLRLKSTVLLHC